MANLRQLDDCSQQVSVAASASSAGPLSAGEGVRDAAPVPCLVPGFADACKLVTAPYSCLVTETHRRHVALPPMHLKKKKTGIQEELNAELLKYSTSLQGVPLAYDGIKVLGQHGDIIGDQGYIHLNIEATFVIFKPKRGEKLVGVINKIGVGHVGCLVHGCFNACVLKPTKLTPDQWRASGLQLGGSLAFEVFQLDADVAGVLLIKGRLEKSRVQELFSMFSSTEAEEQSELASAEAAAEPGSDAAEGAEEGGGAPRPKKKKKKKDKRPDAVMPEDAGSNQAADWMSLEVDGNGMETHSDPDGQPKKKKKKDKRQESPEEESRPEEVAPPAELQASDSSGYISDKRSQKRKTQDNSNMPVTKKKKK